MYDENERGQQGYAVAGRPARAGDGRQPAGRPGIAKKRGLEGDEGQCIDEQGVAEMNGDIEQMISDHLHPTQPVVEGEGEIAYETTRVVPVPGVMQQKIPQIADHRIIGNRGLVVE